MIRGRLSGLDLLFAISSDLSAIGPFVAAVLRLVVGSVYVLRIGSLKLRDT
jgi:hypothetical protein